MGKSKKLNGQMATEMDSSKQLLSHPRHMLKKKKPIIWESWEQSKNPTTKDLLWGGKKLGGEPMSKPTTEEMLECLQCLIENTPCLENGCVNPPHATWTFDTCEDICQAIRALIEASDKGPEVDRAWVYELGALIVDSQSPFGPPFQKAIELLRETGVTVKDDK